MFVGRRVARLLCTRRAAVLTLVLLVGGSSPAIPAEPAFQLQLLHFSDVDGGGTAALSRVDEFSALVDHFRSRYAKRTLLLSSGDNFIPGPIFEAANDPRMAAVIGESGPGRGAIALLNRMGVDAAVLGNHELDPGPAALAGIITPDGDYPGARWPYLAANVDFRADPHTRPLVRNGDAKLADLSSGSLASSVVIPVDGEPIGVVGAVTPTLPAITTVGNLAVYPRPFAEDKTGMAALAAIIQEEVDRLVGRGVDKIILLAHMQRLQVEHHLATGLRDVDIIVAGGSGRLLANAGDRLHDGDSAAEDYPEIRTGAGGEPVLLVNTGPDFRYLGRLVVGFDAEGVILTDDLDPEVNGAWAALPEVVADLGAKPVAEVVEVSRTMRKILKDLDGEALGITSVFLEGRRSAVRMRETNLGNLTADANLWYAQRLAPDHPPQVSVKNGGGIRAPIGTVAVSGDDRAGVPGPPAGNDLGKPEGGISQLDIQTSLAFNNGLSLVDMTAAELRDLAEALVGDDFGHTAGLRVEFDRQLPARATGDTNHGASTDGRRIRALQVCLGSWNAGVCGGQWETVVKDGVTQSTGRSYRVVALDFLAACAAPSGHERATPNCGNGWPFKGLAAPRFASLREARFAGRDPGRAGFASTGSEQDALAEYLRAVHPDADRACATPPDVNRRMIPVGD